MLHLLSLFAAGFARRNWRIPSELLAELPRVQFSLRLRYRMAGVIRVLLIATIIGYSPNDFFRVIASRQGAFGKSPVSF
jgi:hypothetical protein